MENENIAAAAAFRQQQDVDDDEIEFAGRVSAARQSLKLDLGYLALRWLPSVTYSIPNLHILWLEHNALQELPVEVCHLRITQLRLNHNHLTRLPPEIGLMTTLQILQCQNNQLQTLPREIAQLRNLLALQLDHNHLLTKLPSDLCRVTSLTSIHVKGCPLNTPPKIIVKLGLSAMMAWLKRLDNSNKTMTLFLSAECVAHPRFKSKNGKDTFSQREEEQERKKGLPSNISSSRGGGGGGGTTTTTSTMIMIGGGGGWGNSSTILQNLPTHLDSFPMGICDHITLTSLCIFNCGLAILPPGISSLFRLREFDLRYNELKSLPLELGLLTNLGKLYLKGNQLSGMPDFFELEGEEEHHPRPFTMSANGKKSFQKKNVDEEDEDDEESAEVAKRSESRGRHQLQSRLLVSSGSIGLGSRGGGRQEDLFGDDNENDDDSSMMKKITKKKKQKKDDIATATDEKKRLLRKKRKNGAARNDSMVMSPPIDMLNASLTQELFPLNRVVEEEEDEREDDDERDDAFRQRKVKINNHQEENTTSMMQERIKRKLKRREKRKAAAAAAAVNVMAIRQQQQQNQLQQRQQKKESYLVPVQFFKVGELIQYRLVDLLLFLRKLLESKQNLELEFCSVGLRAFPIELFRWSHLRSLILQNHQIASIPSGIRHLRAMENLCFADNLLSALPPELQALKNLKTLDLRNNRFSRLPDWLGRLSKMTELQLSHNYLVRLPLSITCLVDLEKLELACNCLKSLPFELGVLSNLMQLSCHSNDIREVPPPEILAQPARVVTRFLRTLSEKGAKRWLDLSSFGLVTVPKHAVSGVRTCLTRLSLSDNRLRKLAPELCALTDLTDLDLSCNELEELPSNIDNLVRLTSLDVSTNKLKYLPCALCRMHLLREVGLDNNPELDSPPPIIANLGFQAAKVYLETVLEAIASGSLDLGAYKPSLRRSNLSYHYRDLCDPDSVFRRMSSDVSSSLPILRELWLEDNDLVHFPREMKIFSTLTGLYLSDNRFESFPLVCRDWPGLQVLALGGNPLKKVPSAVQFMTSLETLLLGSTLIEFLPLELGLCPALKGVVVDSAKMIMPPSGVCATPRGTAIPLYLRGLHSARFTLSLDLATVPLGRFPFELVRPDIAARHSVDMYNLIALNLSSTGLLSLPQGLGYFAHLTSLTTMHNRIDALPNTICNLRGIRVLEVGYNRLRELPDGIFDNLTVLQRLCIQNNLIRFLSTQAGAITSLTYLDTNNNDWESPPKDVCNRRPNNLAALRFLAKMHKMKEKTNHIIATLGDHATAMRALEEEADKAVNAGSRYDDDDEEEGEDEEGEEDGEHRHSVTTRSSSEASSSGDEKKSKKSSNKKKAKASSSISSRHHRKRRSSKGKKGSVASSSVHSSRKRYLGSDAASTATSISQHLLQDDSSERESDDVYDSGGSRNSDSNSGDSASGSDGEEKEQVEEEEEEEEGQEGEGENVFSSHSMIVVNPTTTGESTTGAIVGDQQQQQQQQQQSQLDQESANMNSKEEGEEEDDEEEEAVDEFPIDGAGTVGVVLETVAEEEEEQQRIQQLIQAVRDPRKEDEALYNIDATMSENLESFGLSSFPPELLQLEMLQQLELHDNSIHSIPQRIGNMKVLRVLRLDDNLIETLPISIGKCRRLEVLRVAGNQLISLPTSIGLLNSLVVVDFSRNRLLELPSSIGNWMKLRTLLLHSNALIQLTSSVFYLTSLTAMTIHFNPQLEALPAELGTLDELRFLEADSSTLLVPQATVVEKGAIQILDYLSVVYQSRVTRRVDFSRFALTEFPRETSQMPFLAELIASDGSIAQIPESIGSLSLLQVLRLERNQLRQLPQAFSGLISLKALDLSFNQLASIDTVGANSFSELVHFRARSNLLQSIPDKVLAWGKLQVLDLACNHLISLPRNLGKLLQLQELYLSHNRLTQLPRRIRLLSGLTKLHLEDNPWEMPSKEVLAQGLAPIFNFFHSIRSCKDDGVLDLSGSKLREFPFDLLKLTHVRSLSLARNSIPVLPPEFKTWDGLLELDLSHNKFVVLPDCLSSLARLNSLNLSENAISVMPDVISYMTSLSQLNMAGNKLREVSIQVIGNLTQLRELRCDSNLIEDLPEELGRCMSLRVLSFDRNLLSTFPVEILKMSSLEQLSCAFNGIHWLPDVKRESSSSSSLDEVACRTSLRTLNFANNPLERVPEWFADCTSLDQLYLSGTRVKILPPRIGLLRSLRILKGIHSDFECPPSYLTTRGTVAMMGYLRRMRRAETEGILEISGWALPHFPRIRDVGMVAETTTSLDLSRNNIAELGPEIGLFKSLRFFSCHHNMLETLPTEFGWLVTLEKVDLSHNRLRCIKKAEETTTTGVGGDSRPQSPLPGPRAAVSSRRSLLLASAIKNSQSTGEMITDSTMAPLMRSTSGSNLTPKSSAVIDPELGSQDDTLAALKYLHALVSLDIHHNELEALPNSVCYLTRLWSLQAQNNRIQHIPRRVGRLDSLVVMRLGQNEIKELPGTIGRLTSLVEIDLAHNQLTELPVQFSHMKRLQRAKLHDNDWQCPPLQIIEKGIPRIYAFLAATVPGGGGGRTATTTDLSSQQQQQQQQQQRIASVDLSGMSLRIVTPAMIARLAHLKGLSLSNNLIDILPQQIGSMTVLQTLDLGDNLLQSLPAAFAMLASTLQTLNLAGNKLRSIPSSLLKCTFLTDLDLSRNIHLQVLPEEISDLSLLVRLDVSDTDVASLPSTIGRLQNLDSLRMLRTPLGALPPSINSLKKLTQLWLFEDRMSFLPIREDLIIALRRSSAARYTIGSLIVRLGAARNLSHKVMRDLAGGWLTCSVSAFGKEQWSKKIPYNADSITFDDTIEIEVTARDRQLLEERILHAGELASRSGGGVGGGSDHQSSHHNNNSSAGGVGGSRNNNNRKGKRDEGKNDNSSVGDVTVSLMGGPSNMELRIGENIVHMDGDLSSNSEGKPKWLQLNQIVSKNDPRAALLQVQVSFKPLERERQAEGSRIGDNARGVLALKAFSSYDIPETAMAEAKRSRRLNLGGYGMAMVPVEVLAMPFLQELLLNNNKIRIIPPGISALSSLTRLSFHSNRVASVHPNLFGLSTLTELHLGSNRLLHLSKKIGLLTKLRTLGLANNEIQLLPPHLCLLTMLEELDVAGNPLHSPPPSIQQRGMAAMFAYLGKVLNARTSDSLDLSKEKLAAVPTDVAWLKGLRALNLSRNSLTRLPAQLSALLQLRDLDCSHNVMPELSPVIFELSALTSLNLSDNEIAELPVAVTKVEHLKILSVDGNRLSELAPHVVFQLGKLEQLSASRNAISSMNFDPRYSTKTVTRLDVSNNLLSDISPLTQLEGLRILQAADNGIDMIPGSMSQLSQLVALNFTRNSLRSISAELCKNISLRQLVLSENQIESIPVEIGNLTTLEALMLERNRLEHVPSTIGHLTRLTELNLDENQLSDIPDQICALHNLEQLWLHANHIQHLPDAIGLLSCLRVLTLSDNAIQNIPSTIGELTRLEELWLKGNPLSEVPPSFTRLQRLKVMLLDRRMHTTERRFIDGEGGD